MVRDAERIVSKSEYFNFQNLISKSNLTIGLAMGQINEFLLDSELALLTTHIAIIIDTLKSQNTYLLNAINQLTTLNQTTAEHTKVIERLETIKSSTDLLNRQSTLQGQETSEIMNKNKKSSEVEVSLSNQMALSASKQSKKIALTCECYCHSKVEAFEAQLLKYKRNHFLYKETDWIGFRSSDKNQKKGSADFLINDTFEIESEKLFLDFEEGKTICLETITNPLVLVHLSEKILDALTQSQQVGRHIINDTMIKCEASLSQSRPLNLAAHLTEMINKNRKMELSEAKNMNPNLSPQLNLNEFEQTFKTKIESSLQQIFGKIFKRLKDARELIRQDAGTLTLVCESSIAENESISAQIIASKDAEINRLESIRVQDESIIIALRESLMEATKGRDLKLNPLVQQTRTATIFQTQDEARINEINKANEDKVLKMKQALGQVTTTVTQSVGFVTKVISDLEANLEARASLQKDQIENIPIEFHQGVIEMIAGLLNVSLSCRNLGIISDRESQKLTELSKINFDELQKRIILAEDEEYLESVNKAKRKKQDSITWDQQPENGQSQLGKLKSRANFSKMASNLRESSQDLKDKQGGWADRNSEAFGKIDPASDLKPGRITLNPKWMQRDKDPLKDAYKRTKTIHVKQGSGSNKGSPKDRRSPQNDQIREGSPSDKNDLLGIDRDAKRTAEGSPQRGSQLSPEALAKNGLSQQPDDSNDPLSQVRNIVAVQPPSVEFETNTIENHRKSTKKNSKNQKNLVNWKCVERNSVKSDIDANKLNLVNDANIAVQQHNTRKTNKNDQKGVREVSSNKQEKEALVLAQTQGKKCSEEHQLQTSEPEVRIQSTKEFCGSNPRSKTVSPSPQKDTKKSPKIDHKHMLTDLQKDSTGRVESIIGESHLFVKHFTKGDNSEAQKFRQFEFLNVSPNKMKSVVHTTDHLTNVLTECNQLSFAEKQQLVTHLQAILNKQTNRSKADGYMEGVLISPKKNRRQSVFGSMYCPQPIIEGLFGVKSLGPSPYEVPAPKSQTVSVSNLTQKPKTQSSWSKAFATTSKQPDNFLVTNGTIRPQSKELISDNEPKFKRETIKPIRIKSIGLKCLKMSKTRYPFAPQSDFLSHCISNNAPQNRQLLEANIVNTNQNSTFDKQRMMTCEKFETNYRSNEANLFGRKKSMAPVKEIPKEVKLHNFAFQKVAAWISATTAEKENLALKNQPTQEDLRSFLIEFAELKSGEDIQKLYASLSGVLIQSIRDRLEKSGLFNAELTTWESMPVKVKAAILMFHKSHSVCKPICTHVENFATAIKYWSSQRWQMLANITPAVNLNLGLRTGSFA